MLHRNSSGRLQNRVRLRVEREEELRRVGMVQEVEVALLPMPLFLKDCTYVTYL